MTGIVWLVTVLAIGWPVMFWLGGKRERILEEQARARVQRWAKIKQDQDSTRQYWS